MADQNFRVKNGLEVTNGSVGVGTTNPTSKLHVVGDGRFTGVVTATTFVGAVTGTVTGLNRTVTAGSGLSGGGTLTSDITLNVGSGTGITVNADDVQLKNSASLTNNRVTKWDSSNGQLTNTIITDDGTNVGIGSTIPTSKLDVVGVATFSDSVYLTRSKSLYFGDKFDIIQNGSTQSIIRSQSGNTIYIASGDEVRITDTTGVNNSAIFTPSTDVVLRYANSTKFRTTNTGVTVTGQYEIGGTSVLTGTTLGAGVVNSSLTGVGTLTQLSVSGVTTSALLNVGVGGTIITTTSLGLVGLGTTNPTSKLHVVGDGRFTGVVTATTFVGALTGTATTSTTVSSDSDNNTKGGTGAGSSLVASSGTNNTFFGFSAGSRVTTGDYNIALGSNALIGALSGVTGSNNVSMGRNSGNNITSANSNNFLGYFAGHNTNSGSYNNFFGYAAGYGNTTGSNNNFFGYYSGKNNTSGTNNNFFGNNVGVSNTTGYNNTFFGYQTGQNNTSGNNNIFFGYRAGTSNNNGSDNMFFGRDVAFSNTSGNHNIFFGYETGWFNNTGSDNVFIGQKSGYNNTGSNNSFFGSFAGYDNTSGSNNVAIGHSAQLPIASGSNQLVIGSGSTAWINGNSSYNVGLGTTNPTSKLHVVGDGRFTGVVTATSFSGNASSATYATTAGIATNANFVDIQTNTTTDAIYYVPYATGTGHTSLYVDISLSYNPGQDLLTLRNVQGTKISLDEGINAIGVITASSFSGNASSATYATTAGIATNVIGGIGSITRLQVTGISTFTNGPVLIGSGTSTGTASQRLQVTGGAYVSGSVGIGTTNPQYPLDVIVNSSYARIPSLITSQLNSPTGNLYLESTGINADSTITASSFVKSGGTSSQFLKADGSVDTNSYITSASVGNGTLTLQVSGIGLTGSASFTANQSGNSTFTVTSDATSANTSSTIVARDASGGFSAGIITATSITATSHKVTGNVLSWNPTTPGTNVGGIHLGASSLSNFGSAITFGAGEEDSGENAQAGIYIRAGDTYGTNMYLATTDNFESGSKVAISIDPFGAVNITRSNLKVAGIVTATDFNSTSDVKLKTNIRPIEDSLDKVLQIQGVSFNWIEGNKPSMGVIADEVQKILPELVSDTDPKTVNYNGLIGLLIEVVKEQNNKIELLENRISKLE